METDKIDEFMKKHKCRYYGSNGNGYFVHQVSQRYWRIENLDGSFFLNMRAHSFDIVMDVLGRFDFEEEKTKTKRLTN